MKARDVAKRINARAIKINAGGARPRPGVDRYPSGQIRHDQRQAKETEADIMQTAIAQRLRAGVPMQSVRSQLAESPLGRLALTGQITVMQYEAGRRYARTTARYHALMGVPSPWPRPVDLDGGPTGRSNKPEPEPDRVDEIKRDYADMRREILDLEISSVYHGTGKALYDVILLEHEVESNVAVLGNLRSGLNKLARMWGMTPA